MKLKFDLQLDDGVLFRLVIALVVLLVELLSGFYKQRSLLTVTAAAPPASVTSLV